MCCLFCLFGSVAWGSAPPASEKTLPVSEEAIAAEIDALVDSTGPVKDQDQLKARKLLEKGVKAHDQKQYEKALGYFQEALRHNPTFATAYYEMGLSYYTMGEAAEALDRILRAIALDPTNDQFFIMKANILDDLGFPAEARKTYESLLGLMPESYLGRVNLGILLFRQGDAETAEAELKKAVAIQPASPSAYYHLGTLAGARNFNYEEQEHFTKFLEVGRNDPRAEKVRRRLAELEKSEVNFNLSEPYSQITLAAHLARSLWKSAKHREQNPGARGYRLTYAEEKEVYSDFILPAWREEKAKDPQARHAFFDLLLAIDEAGFLDEFIYYTKQNQLGETATEWLREHSARVESFLSWAREKGFIKPDPEMPASQGEKSGIQKLMEIMEKSPVHYNLGMPSGEECQGFAASEGKRFQAAFAASEGDTAGCPRTLAEFRSRLLPEPVSTSLLALRCSFPGDELYEAGLKALSLGGVQARDFTPAPPGCLAAGEGRIDIKTTLDPGWMFYFMAKAAWRMEPALRREFAGEEVYQPSLQEEIFAFDVAAQSYGGLRKAAEEKGEAFAQDPLFEMLMTPDRPRILRGFVLFEVFHKLYRLRLASLNGDDAQALDLYLRTQVLVRTSARGNP